jgi:hypothetical protein
MDAHASQDILATCDTAFLCSEFKRGASFSATFDQSTFMLSYPHGEKKLDINLLTLLFILHNQLSILYFSILLHSLTLNVCSFVRQCNTFASPTLSRHVSASHGHHQF